MSIVGDVGKGGGGCEFSSWNKTNLIFFAYPNLNLLMISFFLNRSACPMLAP
jgi:hypothetical protein